jgi:GNAT superfamily N-acetyltransferase
MNIIQLDIDHIRQFWASLFETYNALVPTAEFSREEMEKHFLMMIEQGSVVFVAVTSDADDNPVRICGALTVLLEYKMIRWGVIAAHIEDLVVDTLFQWQWIWSRLLEAALSYARTHHAYKIILDCEEWLATYYHRHWFDTAWVCMKQYC